jgi:methyl-accepting chemotaxis protein
LQRVKVTGPVYTNIIQGKDLIADILPPPEFIVESYLTLFELAGTKDEAKRTALLEKAERLRAEYLERHAYWDKNLTDEATRTLLLRDMYAPAMRFYQTQETRFLPALREGNLERVNTLLYGELREDFNLHRDAVLQLVDRANADVAATEKATLAAITRDTWALVLFGALITLLCYGVALVIISSILRPMRALEQFSTNIAAGDLNQCFSMEQGGEIGKVAGAVCVMVENLKVKIDEAEQKSVQAEQESQRATSAMRESDASRQEAERSQGILLRAVDRLQQVVIKMADSSHTLSDQVERSRHGAQAQSARISETATAMEEMTATVLEVARSAGDAAESAVQASHKAKAGAEVVEQVVQGITLARTQALGLKGDMDALGDKAQNIGRIMGVISDIADQTNLLALNAAIEAARAGDAGRGFAVVADEVRKLAEKTMEATRQVGEAIQGIQQGTGAGRDSVERAVAAIEEATGLAGRSGQALTEIVGLVELASDQVRAIAAASGQQSAASDEISRSIEEVDAISTQTAEGMHDSARVVAELDDEARTLRGLIEELRTRRG